MLDRSRSSACDPVGVGDGFAGWIDDPSDQRPRIAEDGACDVLAQVAAPATVGCGHRETPPGGTVDSANLLDDADERFDVGLMAAQRDRKPYPVQAAVHEGGRDFVGEPAFQLDARSTRLDRGSQRACELDELRCS